MQPPLTRLDPVDFVLFLASCVASYLLSRYFDRKSERRQVSIQAQKRQSVLSQFSEGLAESAIMAQQQGRTLELSRNVIRTALQGEFLRMETPDHFVTESDVDSAVQTAVAVVLRQRFIDDTVKQSAMASLMAAIDQARTPVGALEPRPAPGDRGILGSPEHESKIASYPAMVSTVSIIVYWVYWFAYRKPLTLAGTLAVLAGTVVWLQLLLSSAASYFSGVFSKYLKFHSWVNATIMLLIYSTKDYLEAYGTVAVTVMTYCFIALPITYLTLYGLARWTKTKVKADTSSH